jgi:uncharacterized protein (TIGR00266 family)
MIFRKRGEVAVMADQIDFSIIGDDMQAVVIALDPEESVQAEAGAMMFMENDIDMHTEAGGVGRGLKRMLAGESFFFTRFTNRAADPRHVAFSAPYPGKILPLQLDETGAMLCQRDAYLCSAFGIEVSIAFTKRFGAGFFGGEGFILEKLSGNGLAFVHAGGTLVEKSLAAGGKIRVDTGCLVAFQESVDYSIELVKGLKSAIFGGEGLFFATLTGPGKIFLQSLPLARMANRILSAARTGREDAGGGILGGLAGLTGGDRRF